METLGAPVIDNDANKELFEEQMEIIFKAFNEDSFSHYGKHYSLPAKVPYRGYELEEITLVPRPINRPVEMWQPIASGRTLEYIARKGIKGMVALTGELLVEQMFRSYQEYSALAGRELTLGQDMGLGLGFCIDESQAAAIEKVRPYHDERYKWFAPSGSSATPTPRPALGDPGSTLPGTYHRRGSGAEGLAVRAPGLVIDRLREVEQSTPVLRTSFCSGPRDALAGVPGAA